MTYYVLTHLGAPHQIHSDLSGWDRKVPDIHRQARVSETCMYGRGLLKPTDMPDVLPLENGPKILPAVFFSDSGIVVCSTELRTILEEFNPGLHQFIPIKVILRTGGDAPGAHFILNVHHMLDTIVDDLTKATKSSGLVPGERLRHYMFLRLDAERPGDVTVNRSRLTSANLWREKAYPRLYMMSDALHHRLKAAKMRFFKAIKATEI
jgi:hypothetical protein